MVNLIVHDRIICLFESECLLGSIYTKRQHHWCDDACTHYDTVSLTTLELLQNGWQPHSQATSLWPVRLSHNPRGTIDATLTLMLVVNGPLCNSCHGPQFTKYNHPITLGPAYNEFGYNEHPPTTSRFLCIKIIGNNVKKFGYYEHHPTRSSFLCSNLLVPRGTPCSQLSGFLFPPHPHQVLWFSPHDCHQYHLSYSIGQLRWYMRTILVNADRFT